MHPQSPYYNSNKPFFSVELPGPSHCLLEILKVSIHCSLLYILDVGSQCDRSLTGRIARHMAKGALYVPLLVAYSCQTGSFQMSNCVWSYRMLIRSAKACQFNPILGCSKVSRHNVTKARSRILFVLWKRSLKCCFPINNHVCHRMELIILIIIAEETDNLLFWTTTWKGLGGISLYPSNWKFYGAGYRVKPITTVQQRLDWGLGSRTVRLLREEG